MSRYNLRAIAAQVCFEVVDKGRSLSDELPRRQHDVSDNDKALLAELCYGVIRYLPRLECFCQHLLEQPLKGKNRLFQFLLYVGLYQLAYLRIPSHAALSETVEACKALRAPGLKGLVNAVLRSFQRQQTELEQLADSQPVSQHLMPNWLLKKLQHAYPERWQDVVAQCHQRAPMWLRVNAKQFSQVEYKQALDDAEISAVLNPMAAPNALCLSKPCAVEILPGFDRGSCSVQDGAAQFAAHILNPQAGERVLDACSAPGGKSCHLLELADINLTSLDADAYRLLKVHENLDRLGLEATVKTADAADLASWWDGELFDAILADVPCSATGVIRRHPDIKWLRKPNDISALVDTQANILAALWQTLKPGGRLLYATCSILPEENSDQIEQFLDKHPDARLQPIVFASSEHNAELGWQILPGTENMDGFYYAMLHKVANT